MSITTKTYTQKSVEVKDVYIVKEMSDEYIEHMRLSNPTIISEYLYKAFEHLDNGREHFISLSLNTKNELIATNVISFDSLNASIVHPREVFYSAIVDMAASIVICHNHPSGDVKPSQNDVNLTRKLYEAGKIIGIDVLDHIIIGDKWKYYSFKENNFM